MLQLLGATGNANKLAELRTVAKDYSIEILSPERVSEEKGLGAPPDVEETSETYRGNALLKAQAFCRWANMPAIGDDSGLEVVALDRRPGVFSARYAGEHATNEQRIDKLLGELAALEQGGSRVDRTAYFVCHLALVFPDSREIFSDAKLKGEILYESRGEKGFGYDPIVFIHSLQKTLAEVEFEVTCTKGFRAEAARKLYARLDGLTESLS